MSPADFIQSQLFPKNISGIPSVSNSLDQDQARRFVRPDLGRNPLQSLSDIGRQH